MSYRSAPSQHKVAVCKTCEGGTVTRHIVTERHWDGAHFERIVRLQNGVTKYAKALICLKCATATNLMPH
jgi:hypothetical protein